MFTEITYTGHNGTAIVGDKVTGGTSGAILLHTMIIQMHYIT